MIFVRTPSLEETRRRLEGRATETSEALESRMKSAVKEVAARDEFDYEIINGDPERARREIIDLMTKIAEGGDDAE
jgi:guanylate kinase